MPASRRRLRVRMPLGGVNEASISKDGETFSLVERKTKFNTQLLPFLNDDFGNQMNQDAAFGGTPDRIHDGIDTTLYTASSIVGIKSTFNDTTHVFQGIATIVDYSLIDAGETVTITVDGSQTVLTAGGTDWTAAVANSNTAASLASAINGVTGVSASATAAVVTVLADSGSDITELVTSGTAGELIVTGQSIETNNPAVGDIMQFAKGSDITMANFVGVSMRIYVSDSWLEDDSVSFYAWDTGLGQQVGDKVFLEDFFTFSEFDQWHGISISLNDLGVPTSTIVDAFRVEVESRQGAKSPLFYLDRLNLEQTGTPISFRVTAVAGDFHIKTMRLGLADALDSRLANSSMPNLSYDKLLGLTELNTGITFRRVQDGKTEFSFNIHHIGDAMSAGSTMVNCIGDGTNTYLTLEVEFSQEIILEGSPSLNYLEFIINDDLSGLLQFTANARGGRVIS